MRVPDDLNAAYYGDNARPTSILITREAKKNDPAKELATSLKVQKRH